MRITLVTLLFTLLYSQVDGQEDIEWVSPEKKDYKNIISLELGGTGGFYNLGYERMIYSKGMVGLYTGVEASYRKISPRITDYDMVFAFNLLGFTYGKKHQLDVELSTNWAVNFNPYPNSILEQLRQKRLGNYYKLTFASWQALGIGYRWNIKKRWLLRAKFLYMFRYDFEFKEYYQQPWFDVGFGFKF